MEDAKLPMPITIKWSIFVFVQLDLEEATVSMVGSFCSVHFEINIEATNLTGRFSTKHEFLNSTSTFSLEMIFIFISYSTLSKSQL